MAQIIKYQSSSLKDSESFANSLAKRLKKGSIVAFFGELGTGKTTIIKTIASHFDIKEVQSPTFVYLNIYDSHIPIYHFDLYRIKDSNDFINMGFDEYLSKNGICLIEWAEKIKDILPEDTITIHISHKDINKRELLVYEKNEI